MAKKTTNEGPISFKLPERELRALLEAEAEREGLSIHQAARRLVLRALSDDWKDELLEQVGEIRKDQRRLRQDLATLVRPLLAHVFQQDLKAIDKWIREQLSV